MKKLFVLTALLTAVFNLTSCVKKIADNELQPVGDATEIPADSVQPSGMDSTSTGTSVTSQQASDLPAQAAQPATRN